MSKFIDIVKDLPYNRLLAVKEAIKMRFGTVSWPDHAPTLIVTDRDVEELEHDLRAWHYEGLYLSYNYEGQVLDLRRPEGVSNDGKQLELHIRARDSPDEEGLEVLAHLELSRYEHKRDHIHGEGLIWLDEADLRHVLSGGDLNPEGGVVEMGW